MIEKFNRINQAVGANRMRVLGICAEAIRFEVKNWAAFQLESNGILEELVDGRLWVLTPRSYWLSKVGDGYKRDDAGNLLPPGD